MATSAAQPTPGQRWVSESEPELGLGVILSAGGGRVEILFAAAGERRHYALASAPLRRVEFRVGDTIRTQQGVEIDVEEVRHEDGLLLYVCNGTVVPEAELSDTISVNSLTVLLREEGFSRLPRRADDERPPTVKAEIAEAADVRRLDLSPRSFRTPLAGLFLFLPLLDGMDLQNVVTAARLPGSKMIPAAQAVRSLLALKLIGAERKSHVMDLVMDQAIAVFAGINVVPKRSYLAAYSSRIDHKACLRFMQAWLQQVETAGLPHGASFDLDFHSVPANSSEEPLEKHYVSSRSRSSPHRAAVTSRLLPDMRVARPSVSRLTTRPTVCSQRHWPSRARIRYSMCSAGVSPW